MMIVLCLSMLLLLFLAKLSLLPLVDNVFFQDIFNDQKKNKHLSKQTSIWNETKWNDQIAFSFNHFVNGFFLVGWMIIAVNQILYHQIQINFFFLCFGFFSKFQFWFCLFVFEIACIDPIYFKQKKIYFVAIDHRRKHS